jgi:hypothetical protein
MGGLTKIPYHNDFPDGTRQIHSEHSFKAEAADRSPTWDGKQVNLNRLSDTLPELPLL